MDNLPEFKEAALKCVKVDPSFTKRYYRLAKAHGLLWEYEKKKGLLEKGLSVDSTNSDLRKMLESVNGRLEWMMKFHEIVLKLPQSKSSFKFLGGLPLSGKCKIPQNTVYSILDRRPLPPLSKKHKNLMQYDKKIRHVIGSFFNRKLKVKWFCTADSIHVDGYLPNETVPVISYMGEFGMLGLESAFVSGYSTEQNTTYQNVLTNIEKTICESSCYNAIFEQKDLNWKTFTRQRFLD